MCNVKKVCGFVVPADSLKASSAVLSDSVLFFHLSSELVHRIYHLSHHFYLISTFRHLIDLFESPSKMFILRPFLRVQDTTVEASCYIVKVFRCKVGDFLLLLAEA